jgi:hypothetical protein
VRNNNLSLEVPEVGQLNNYLYRTRERLIAQHYPEVKSFLTEIVKKTYKPDLRDDELFYIHSSFQDGEVLILFSTKLLVNNLIRQALNQEQFIHLDGTSQ